jgi:hypothetical protein
MTDVPSKMKNDEWKMTRPHLDLVPAREDL